MASVNQIKRLLGLLDHLQSEEPYNARQLAEKVGVSRRTLFRDLRALEKLGFGVRYDERAGRYVVEGDVGQSVGDDSSDRAGDLKTLMDLGHRLENSPDELKSRIAELPTLIELRSGSADRETDAGVFRSLMEGLCQRRKLRLMRSTEGGGTQVQSITPYRLTFSQAEWHLIGETDSGGVSLVPVSDIVRADVSDETFRMPESSEVDRMSQSVLNASEGSESFGDVVVRFSADIARQVAERRWFQNQELEWLDDGRLEMRTGGGAASRVLQWVLSFGADASVVQPDDLRKRVARHASQMAEQYGTTV